MKKSTINKVSISFLLGLISCLYASDDDLRPIEHKCPITLDVMRDPVVASDGHTYEKHAIEQHFGIRATSPSTGLAISKNLIPNHALKKMIEEWKPGRQDLQSELDNLDSKTIAERVKSEFDAHASLFSSSKNEDIVVVLGNTGAGKSTLVNLLAGKELAISEDGRDYVLLNPQDRDAMSIGTGGDSETRYPKSIVVDGLRFFDFPGFNDTDGSVLNLVNAAFIRKILMEAQSVRFIIVVGEDQFTVDRGESAKKLFDAMKRLFVVSEETMDIIDHSIFVVTKSASIELEKTKNFLISKTSGQNKALLQKQLELWNKESRLWHMHSPQLPNHSELNLITKGVLRNMIENSNKIKVAGINVSVLYPPEMRRPLVRMFDHMMEEDFNHRFQRPLTTLSEFDGVIDFYESDNFWQNFQARLCKNQSVHLLKDFCIDQYSEAERNFKEKNAARIACHITELKNKRQLRHADVEKKTEIRANDVIASLVPQQTDPSFIQFDFAYHKDFYDHVCGEPFINNLAEDQKEQEVVRRYYAGFISRHSHDQMMRWHKKFADSQPLMEKMQKMEDRLQSIMDSALPAFARGHEDAYRDFLNLKLVYKPDPNSDNGKVILPVKALANPLDGVFDLSNCGDAAQHLSISTGYRKGKNPANANKLEIWLTPRFVAERNLNGTAAHLKPIWHEWHPARDIGVFFTWGNWDNDEWYDYEVKINNDVVYTKNIYETFTHAKAADAAFDTTIGRWLHGWPEPRNGCANYLQKIYMCYVN
ncbi:MAG: hypothetical protein KBD31_03115 [Proteobacteria bacterium]|nr:hypothetical protein [Pseudomonadota bacterium]